MRRSAAVVAGLGLLVAVVPRTAVAQGALGLSPASAVTLDCWDDVRLFTSLGGGNFDYCRSRLRYVPGRLECYRLVDRVCLVYLPGSADLTEARSTRVRVAIACPDGPEPPVCRRLDLQ